jgi:hypothetical protein
MRIRMLLVLAEITLVVESVLGWAKAAGVAFARLFR